jgi:hypothetical protein
MLLLNVRMRRANFIGSARGYIRQTGSARLASLAAEMSTVNHRFLSHFRVPDAPRLARQAPPIWLREGIRTCLSKMTYDAITYKKVQNGVI